MNNPTRSLTLSALTSGLLLSLALHAGPARAEQQDAFQCLSGDEKQCAFENESLSLFIQGTDAYDKGRETGDMTEARRIARQLIERKNKYGKRMMKQVYVQLALGTHKNLIEAHRWLQEAMANEEKYTRLDISRLLDQLSQKMSPEQLAEAQKK
jgi:hypothetical protein